MTDEHDDEQHGDFELTQVETVCEACRLVRNKYTNGCGHCLGPSVHDKRGA